MSVVVKEYLLLAAVLITGRFALGTFVLPTVMFLVYWFVRAQVRPESHYKSNLKCAAMSYLSFAFLFLVAREEPFLGILLAGVSSLMYSTKWPLFSMSRQKSGRPSKHLHVFDFIRANYNRDDVLLFEAALKYDGDYAQEVYRRIFKDGDTWDNTMLDLDINKQRLEAEIQALSLAIKHKFDVHFS